MKTTVFLTLPCLVLFTMLAGGCGNHSATTEGEHVHTAECDHDHPGAAPAEDDAHAGHSHAAAGTHGGEVYIVGNDVADVELKHDHVNGQITAWLTNHDGHGLDSGESITLQLFEDGKFVDYTLKKTDTIGMYQLTDKAVCEMLEKSEHLKARLHVTVDGKGATATIEHHAH